MLITAGSVLLSSTVGAKARSIVTRVGTYSRLEVIVAAGLWPADDPVRRVVTQPDHPSKEKGKQDRGQDPGKDPQLDHCGRAHRSTTIVPTGQRRTSPYGMTPLHIVTITYAVTLLTPRPIYRTRPHGRIAVENGQRGR